MHTCVCSSLTCYNYVLSTHLKGPMFKATNKTTAKTHVDFFMVLVNSGCLLRKRVFCSKHKLKQKKSHSDMHVQLAPIMGASLINIL